MDVGVDETKPMAKVMRSKEARWRRHQTKPGNQKTMKGTPLAGQSTSAGSERVSKDSRRIHFWWTIV